MSRPVALSQRQKFELRLNREAGIPLNICAQMAGVSRATAARALAELRALLGPEKVPARKGHLVRFRSDTSRRAIVSNISD